MHAECRDQTSPICYIFLGFVISIKIPLLNLKVYKTSISKLYNQDEKVIDSYVG